MTCRYILCAFVTMMNGMMQAYMASISTWQTCPGPVCATQKRSEQAFTCSTLGVGQVCVSAESCASGQQLAGNAAACDSDVCHR